MTAFPSLVVASVLRWTGRRENRRFEVGSAFLERSRGAPCTLPGSSTAGLGPSGAVVGLSRHMLLSDSRGIVTGIPAWSWIAPATGKILGFPRFLGLRPLYPPSGSYCCLKLCGESDSQHRCPLAVSSAFSAAQRGYRRTRPVDPSPPRSPREVVRSSGIPQRCAPSRDRSGRRRVPDRRPRIGHD